MQAISIDYLERVEYQRREYAKRTYGLMEELLRVDRELAEHGRTDNFYRSLLSAWNKYGSLTERQEAALKRSLTEYHKRNARITASRTARPVSQPVPEGRVTVIGTIRTLKWQENDFGGALKMLVESDFGWRVWGTCPAGLSYAEGGDVEVGDRVSFIATLTRKEADFGFYSRPTKAYIVARKAQAEPQPEALEPAPQEVPQPIEKPIHFAPIAKDIKPEDLIPAKLQFNGQARPDGDTRAERTEARKFTSLTDMVKAAGYTE